MGNREVVDNAMSNWTKVLSRVLQDSILDPVLFLIYINYVLGQVESRVKLFVDDTKLYRIVEEQKYILTLKKNYVNRVNGLRYGS